MVTIYDGQNFKIPKLVLPPPENPSTYKDYSSAYLKENNFINNDNNSVISSYRVTPGWQMTIFTGDINKGDYIFITDKNGKIENGTRIEKIDIRKRVITLSAPLKGGTDLKSPAATALVLNPWQTNVVSSSDLATIRGAKSQKYLEEKFSKLQAFSMFMRGGQQKLNQILKKQIVLTIYGLVSKKGGKLFDPNLTKTVKNKVFAKNAISDYVIPSFIIVGD